MNSLRKLICRGCAVATLLAAVACGEAKGIDDFGNAIIDPPQQCSDDRPDCSVSSDFPDESDLDADNSAGVRFSQESNALVIDRQGVLPDEDLDGVPDDADDCLGEPGWRVPCDGDPSNDGIYRTLFFDDTGANEAERSAQVAVTADIPAIDLYFLVDATSSMEGEIGVLQSEIATVIADVELAFDDPQFGLGLFREYPVDPVAMPGSQAPYHHILDLTDDTALFAKAVSTLNTVENMDPPDAASQALYAISSGQGLADFVPNRGGSPTFGGCPADTEGYPCFRPDALRVVLQITDAEMYNGPRPVGPTYPPFDPLRPGVDSLPPVHVFPSLFDADDAASALDLGDLSGRSLTLMGMSTLLENQVATSTSLGCQTMSGMPPGADIDGRDAVIALRFDAPTVMLADAFANNTHWPAANVALFDDPLLDPAASVACNGNASLRWGAVQWMPATAQPYYLVIDPMIPGGSGLDPVGAFSLGIVSEGDPPNPTWLTADAPVDWASAETELLARKIRVASVISPTTTGMPSEAEPDAREVAALTGAVTKTDAAWLGEVTSQDGEGLGAQISNAIGLIRDESTYDFTIAEVDNDATPGVDETGFVTDLRASDCAEGQPRTCEAADGPRCPACDPGAPLEYELVLRNDFVMPDPADSQVFDFELVVYFEGDLELLRIPVRVMVPNAPAHEFDAMPGTSFYRNTYDSLDRCDAPAERPSWGTLTWSGSTPSDSTIEFQIRTAETEEELDMAVPAVVVIPTDTTSSMIDVRQELIADGIRNGLLFIRVTALLNPSTDFLATPSLEGWELEFTCFAAD